MNGKGQYLPARVLQILGIVLLVAACVYWGFTHEESVLLVSSAMALILLGAYGSTVEGKNGRRNGKDE